MNTLYNADEDEGGPERLLNLPGPMGDLWRRLRANPKYQVRIFWPGEGLKTNFGGLPFVEEDGVSWSASHSILITLNWCSSAS